MVTAILARDPAPPEHAEPLVDHVADGLRRQGVRTAAGRFRAHMHVLLENDGPVTIVVDTPGPAAANAAATPQ